MEQAVYGYKYSLVLLRQASGYDKILGDSELRGIKDTYTEWSKYMIIFNSDLDNTLIYSYRHDIGDDKVCVEIYEGREVSFMTKKSYELLKSIQEQVVFVPTTTRTIEQYNRIDFGIGIPKYALVCNGGILLEGGRENEEWYKASRELAADCMGELKKAETCLEQDKHRIFEIRNIKGLFIFTKSSEPYRSVETLKELLNLSLVDVFYNGVKVYVVPKKLSKGRAVKRFQKYLGADMIIAAGDSEFDVPMLREADIAIAPEELLEQNPILNGTVCAAADAVFSDTILEYIRMELVRNMKLVRN